MPARTGTADLPLHGGRVPAWLATRMATLGRVIVEALVHTYGRDELLARLAHPFWFQSFGAVMGMDWHSSGITTSVLGALKRGLAPVADELGLYVCGGRGRHSRRTPDELRSLGARRGLDADSLVRTSRLVAKVDGAAVQDGYELYLHGFFVTSDGHWTVVQQGMNGDARQARRYHWTWAKSETVPETAPASETTPLSSFVEEPHAAIEGRPGGPIVNLTDRRARAARTSSHALGLQGPSALEVLARARSQAPPQAQASLFAPPAIATPTLSPATETPAVHLTLPAHHDVRAEDLDLARLGKTLAAVAEAGPRDFTELLLVPGVGGRTLFALALVAELVHGAPHRFADPARFSLAHGGKDGHPFPVPLRVYDETIRVMKDAVARAKLGESERLDALARLDREARDIDAAAVMPAELAARVAAERAAGSVFGARTVFDEPPKPRQPSKPRQLSLFGGRR